MVDAKRKQAEEEIAAVNASLSAGHHPTGIPGSILNTSALRDAAGVCGADYSKFVQRVGRPGKPGRWHKFFKLSPDWSLYVAPKVETASTRIPDRRLTQLEDTVRDLRKALRDAHRQQSTEDVLREVIGEIAGAQTQPPKWVTQPPERAKHKPTPEVPVTIWSDFHLGEVVEPAEVNGSNRFNMAVAEERIERLVDATIKLCRHNHVGTYPGAVVNLGGDFVSGGLHPELKATDQEEVIPAAIIAIEWLSAALKRMVDEFGRLYVPCAAGNHGRHTAKPEFKRYYKKNFDWLIYQMLARRFADDKRIVFDIRPSNDVYYRVFNEAYLLCHGDMLGVKGGDGIIGSIGPIVRGGVKKFGQSASFGMPINKILMGHWHQRLWLPGATVNNSLKGFDEYAKNQLGAKPDRATQALFFVHPSRGQTAHWDVYVDNDPAPSREWVAVNGLAA